MTAHAYCSVCGHKNIAGVSACTICGAKMKAVTRKNPMNSASFRSQSMVIFDIDNTILNVEQRYKDARRAGYIDKDGSPARKKTLETPGKARKRANEFLFSPQNLLKDRVIPGALGLVNDLASKGHIIAYVTARHANFRDVTRNQLEEKGFPIFKDDKDMELLFLKPSLGEAKAKYKGDTFAQLNSRYDVRMVFDNDPDNLRAAVTQGITGVYESIKDYTKYQVKNNPWYYGSDGAAYFVPDDDNLKYGGTGGMDPDADPYDSAMAHADASGMGRVPLTKSNKPASAADFFPGDAKVAPYYMRAQTIPITALQNPPVKPRRKKMKNGKYRKEPAKKYVDRFMGDPKMNKEFPDRGQRYAVCLRYVEKFYGKSGLKSVGARPNPAEEYSEDYMVPRDIHRLGKAADSLESTYNEQDVPEWWKSKLSVTAKDADTLADSLDYVADNPGHTLEEDFEQMKQMAYDVRSKEAQGEEVNGREWWNQQIPWIEERYGTEPLDVTWAMPLDTEGFDPYDKSKEFDDNGVKPIHFLNQLKRIPMTKQPTPERIMQIALNIGQGQASGSVETDFTLDDFIIRQNPMPLMGLSVQVSGHRNAAGAFVMKGKKFLILQRSKKETSKHGLWELPGGKVEKGETPRQTAVIETKEEAGLDIKLKTNLGPHHDDEMKKTYHAYVGVAKKGQRVKLSEEHSAHKWVTPEEVMAMPKKMVSHHLRYFLEKESETIKNNPRSNPPKKKIEKGKKLYKHMNGKEPAKIETKKIDMGDVWYQVGEGGCWQIGYMSGKETGKSEQKYTHTFNEETKDGNFPKLYATMPESGKPMLIITGGTWKIRTDDTGVAWIYD